MGGYPPRTVFDEFFWLWENEFGTDGVKFQEDIYEEKMHLNGNYEKAFQRYKTTEKQFASYEDFLTYCFNDYKLSE